MLTAKIHAPVFIGRGPDTEALYRAEEARDRAIRCAARIRAQVSGDVLGLPLTEDEALPQVLLDILDSHSPVAAVAAAIGYLRFRGFRAESLRKPSRFGVWYEVDGNAVVALSSPPGPPPAA